MPSQNKTPLGLSQWAGADRPKREDFNSDNQKIDLACRSALQGLAEHLEGALHPTGTQRERWDAAAGHTGEGIATAGGIHGLRYYEGRLEVNVGGVWTLVSTGEGGAPAAYKVYGVCVDTANPDPAASVVYTDDARGMQPGGDGWQDTFLGALRPCLLRDGQVLRYLDKDNYTLDSSGYAVDITTGDEGDVMVEIPRLAYAIYTEGQKLYVKVTDHPDAARLNPRFCYNAHTRVEQGDRERLYVGAYLGSVLGGRLRSLSGKEVAANQTLLQFRAQAQGGGQGYDVMGYYPYLLLQCLCLIYAGSRHTQQAMGAGYTQAAGGKTLTGGADLRGLFFGEQSGLLQMKAFGVEDLWGNAECFVEGLRTDEAGVIQTATAAFAQAESWQGTGQGGGSLALGYVGQVMGGNDTGFLMRSGGGTTTTGWCDCGERQPGCVALVGGDHYGRNKAGAFYTVLNTPDNWGAAAFGSRLMYL